MKEKKKKLGFIEDIAFCLRSVKKWDKRLYYYQFLYAPPSVLGGYLAVLVPAELLRTLEEGWAIGHILLYITCLLAGAWICEMASHRMFVYLDYTGVNLARYFAKLCFQKTMEVDYAKLEDPDNQKLISNTWNTLRQIYFMKYALNNLPQILAAAISVAWYGVVLGSKNILMVVLGMLSVILNFFLMYYERQRYHVLNQQMGPHAKEAAYISRESMDRAAGKDIRIFHMKDWFMDKYDSSVNSLNGLSKKIHDMYFWRRGSEKVIRFISEGFAYAYLLYLVFEGEITVSAFLLYVGLLKQFVTSLSNCAQSIVSIQYAGVSAHHVREFLSMENDPVTDPVSAEEVEKIRKNAVKIELKDVSFAYPGCDNYVLQDINLVISPGENLALIGLNGAGKTTLVKLICGFYQPTKGQILLNDIPISRFEKKDYYTLISALFQDCTILPVSVDRNLVGEEKAEQDKEQLDRVLSLSGFEEKYQRLPEKGDTLLVKEVNRNAADFSGGEKQKFLFARALYKKAPLLILDEPTAALDPIAENELYLKYKEASEGRTSVFISHRLSSTRFCDRIVLLDNARIIEEGTHESLLQKNGRYANLYQIQSQYYQNEEKGGEESYDEEGLEEHC